MMATTHAAASLFIAVPLALLFPEQSAPIAIGAILGGIFPDLDIIVGTHRKTLHYPVLYWPPTVVLLAVSLVYPSALLLALAVFCLGAATHSVSDIIGGGLEREPWNQTTEKAVYCHPQQRWIPPRHHIPYDGSREDLAAMVVLSASLLAYPTVPFLTELVVCGCVVSVGYAGVRKRLPALEDWLHARFPVLHPFLDGLHGEE